MIRGTTPTHTFTTPFDAALLAAVEVTYAQQDVVVFRKDKRDCECSGHTVSVTLSQEDTLLLDHNYNVQVQLRVLTLDGTALASREIVLSVGKCLSGEVIF